MLATVVLHNLHHATLLREENSIGPIHRVVPICLVTLSTMSLMLLGVPFSNNAWIAAKKKQGPYVKIR